MRAKEIVAEARQPQLVGQAIGATRMPWASTCQIRHRSSQRQVQTLDIRRIELLRILRAISADILDFRVRVLDTGDEAWCVPLGSAD